MNANIRNGLIVSGYGLLGVFMVLILFYLVIRLMVVVSNKFPKKNNEEE